MKVGHSDAFAGHLGEIRRVDFAAKRSDIAEAQVVRDDDEKVGSFRLSHADLTVGSVL